MYKGLIDNLAFVYGYVCKARGKVAAEDMRTISRSAGVMVEHAPAVLGRDDESADDRADLAEAGKMACHIDEMVVFLEHLEIC